MLVTPIAAHSRHVRLGEFASVISLDPGEGLHLRRYRAAFIAWAKAEIGTLGEDWEFEDAQDRLLLHFRTATAAAYVNRVWLALA